MMSLLKLWGFLSVFPYRPFLEPKKHLGKLLLTQTKQKQVRILDEIAVQVQDWVMWIKWQTLQKFLDCELP